MLWSDIVQTHVVSNVELFIVMCDIQQSHLVSDVEESQVVYMGLFYIRDYMVLS